MDLIDRQAAIDALDAVCDRECEYSKQQRSVMCGACRLGSAFDVIDELPSAEPEIIRCKDCFHYTLMPNGCNGQCDLQYTQVMYPWDFCSYGERGQDEQTD